MPPETAPAPADRVDEHLIALHTVDGVVLEGDLAVPVHRVGAAVICHPHPLYGGDRHSNVVEALFAALPKVGFTTVRFDFRGAGGSDGDHGGGVAERLDVQSAIDLVAPLALDGPLLLIGYSFGAMVALTVNDPRLTAWIAVAPPLSAPGRTGPLAGLDLLAPTDHRPKLILHGTHDQFAGPDVVRSATAGWRSTETIEIAMADHFFSGRTAAVAEHVVAFATRAPDAPTA